MIKNIGICFGGYFIGYNYMNNFIKRIEKEEHEERN